VPATQVRGAGGVRGALATAAARARSGPDGPDGPDLGSSGRGLGGSGRSLQVVRPLPTTPACVALGSLQRRPGAAVRVVWRCGAGWLPSSSSGSLVAGVLCSGTAVYLLRFGGIISIPSRCAGYSCGGSRRAPPRRQVAFCGGVLDACYCLSPFRRGAVSCPGENLARLC
jgi:hypothetical protein